MRIYIDKKEDKTMKEFMEPILEIIRFEAEDVLTASGGLDDEENGGGWG